MKKLMALAMAALIALCGAAFSEGMVGLANPWTDTSAEGILDELGLAFGVPAGATDVTYRMLADQKLAEMDFTWDGVQYTARIKPAATFEDISGMYYEWENPQEDFKVGDCAAWEARATDDMGTVDLCMWYDAAPGLMYAVSARSEGDMDGFDILAAAEAIYEPVQTGE